MGVRTNVFGVEIFCGASVLGMNFRWSLTSLRGFGKGGHRHSTAQPSHAVPKGRTIYVVRRWWGYVYGSIRPYALGVLLSHISPYYNVISS